MSTLYRGSERIPFLGQVAKLAYSPLSVTVACPDISEPQYLSKKNHKRKYRIIASEDESRFLFKVIKIKKSKAIVKFIDEMPLEDSFRLPQYNNREIIILKRGKSKKALVQFDDPLELKFNKKYEAIAF